MSDVENVEETTEEVVSVEEELGQIFDESNGPERDELGRFKAKETSDEPEEEPDSGAVEETADVSVEAEEEPETVLDPPASWSATAKAGWASISRELQDEILRREGDWTKADGERLTKLKGYEPIDAAIAPVQQRLALSGISREQYISQLVAADEYLRNSPQEAIKWLAQQYAVDLGQMQAESEVDPALSPLVNQITTLEQKISQLANGQQQAETARADAEIAAFAKDHPHFEDVRAHMGALMQSGTAADMQTAYDMAVWAHPATRALVQSEAEKERKAVAAEKATKAKEIAKTNLSNKGTAGGAAPPQYETREDELSAIYDNAQGA